MTAQKKQAKGGNVIPHTVLGNQDCERSYLRSAQLIWVSATFIYLCNYNVLL
jgi:hypothetical protein